MRSSRFTRFSLLCGLALASLLLVLWIILPRLAATPVEPAGAPGSITLPWHFSGDPAVRTIRIQTRLAAPWFLHQWRIVPDDELLELRVNDRQVSLDSIPRERLQDWRQGFSIDLSPWLKTGENSFEMKVRNNGGNGGLNLRVIPGATALLFLAVPFLLFLAALNIALPLTAGQRCILFLALIVLLMYWSVTPWETRAYDVGLPDGHFGYVSWLADTLAIPAPNAGWTFFHPPLYYILGALALRTADLLGAARAETLQLLSLGFWLVFLSASAASLRICLRGKEVQLLIATAAIALWPSGIIHGIRISNDLPAYACAALAAYFMLCWWKSRRRSALVGMSLCCVLAVLFKTSVIAIIAAGGTMLGWRVLFPGREGRRVALGRCLFFASACLAGLAVSLANNIFYYLRGQLSGWMVGNTSGLNPGLRVPADIKAFIPLDIPTFLTTPWTGAWNDTEGRLNFWNYLLRNSLSGEFNFDGPVQRVIALGWGVMLLLLCVLTLWQLARMPKSGTTAYRQRPLLLLAFFWLASLIALRIQAPFSCSNDFRYIVPILLPAIVFGTASGRTGRVILVLISLSSACFFASLQ